MNRLILGLESTCDETAAAVVDDSRTIRSNVVYSQIDLHRRFRGVVPELAGRAHLEKIQAVVDQALNDAGCSPDDLHAIAVANRPGLYGCLVISLSAAKTLAWWLDKPLIAVDHIHAHAASAAIAHAPPWPAVCLVASGGHTALYRLDSPAQIHRLGGTIDDAVGEAYDKVATMLDLGYPGGPLIDRLTEGVVPASIQLPRANPRSNPFDMSFSGLKTAVLYAIHGPGRSTGGLERLSQPQRYAIAAAFQEAAIDVLIEKIERAATTVNARSILLGGGVACNRRLRERTNLLAMRLGLPLHVPAPELCTDNAAMTAALAAHLLRENLTSPLDVDASPSARTRAPTGQAGPTDPT